MELNGIVYIAILLLSILVPILFYIIGLRNATTNIKSYLIERGATNVVVNHEWSDFDRDTLTFDVVYIGIKGNKINARCKIQHWLSFTDNEIFWSDPMSLELVQIEKEISRSEFYKFSQAIEANLPFKLPTYEISTILPISNSEDQIVMMKYIAAFRNIFRCKPDGSIVWQAELPTESNDVYTRACMQNQKRGKEKQL